MSLNYTSIISTNGSSNGKQTQQDLIKLLHQEKYKSAISKLSGSICVDNLFKKERTVYAKSSQYNLLCQTKNKFQFNKTGLKKEIQPHKVKSSNSLIEKYQTSHNTSHQEKNQNKRKPIPKTFLIPKFNRLNNKPYQCFTYENSQKPKNTNPFISNLYSDKICIVSLLDPKQLKVQSKKFDPIAHNNTPIRNTNYPKIKLKSKLSYKSVNSQQQLEWQNQNQKDIFYNKQDNGRYNVNNFNQQRQLDYGQYFNLPIKKTQSSMQKSVPLKMKHTQLKIIKNIQRKRSINALGFSNSIKNNFTQDSIDFFDPEKLQLTKNQTEKIVLKKITCQYLNAFIVRNSQEEKMVIQNILSKQNDTKVEVASITKAMTCLLALKIAEKFNIDLNQQKVFTTERASKMHGTSAQLQYSESASLFDFLHGLMLPSGNDAAIAIAQWGGKTIRKYCNLALKYERSVKSSNQKQKHTNSYTNIRKRKSNVKLFVYHMNKGCKALSLQNTHFVNPHGLMNHRSYSTAYDVCQLAHISMKNQVFRRIVCKQSYSCKLFNRTYSKTRQMNWKNTNKLIGVPGFQGIKTGITSAAGPCLVSQFRISKKQQVIICVLKARSMFMRFGDTISILKSIIENKVAEVELNQQSQDKNLSLSNYHRILSRLEKISVNDMSFQQEDQHANDYNQDDEEESNDYEQLSKGCQ